MDTAIPSEVDQVKSTNRSRLGPELILVQIRSPIPRSINPIENRHASSKVDIA